MKNIPIPLLSILLVVTFFTSCTLFKKSGGKKYHVMLTNPSAIERADELIVLSREMVEAQTGALGKKYISVSTENNQPVVVQFDDLNKDGRWDEAVFLYKFEPGQQVNLVVSPTLHQPGKAVVRAHVRMRRKNADHSFGALLDSVTVPRNTLPTDFTKQKLPLYLTEGPAWENDKVAFRIYMDNRNTKDIYGKRTQAMMMDTVGVIPANSYHNLADWGMDILAVGKSLGAGSLALSVPMVAGKDTLVRLGGANVEQTTFEKIADGPLRAIFKMHYKNWLVVPGFAHVNVTEEICIWGGKYFYESKVLVENAPLGTKLVTGIVNLKSKKAVDFTTGESKGVYTYDEQSENKDKLGMAVVVKDKDFISFGKAPGGSSDVMNTYTLQMPVSSLPVSFRFFAAWEMSDLLFTREENFKRYLEYEGLKFGSAIRIVWR